VAIDHDIIRAMIRKSVRGHDTDMSTFGSQHAFPKAAGMSVRHALTSGVDYSCQAPMSCLCCRPPRGIMRSNLSTSFGGRLSTTVYAGLGAREAPVLV
jgi:hypothetical protein